MQIRRYIITRIVTAFAIFLFILTINFVLFRTIPGDPIAALFYDPRMTPDDVQRMRHVFGLDRPLWDQYIIYMKNSLSGQMGISFTYREPVWDIVSQRLLNTLVLVGTSALLALFVGILLGTIAAWRRNSSTDFGVLSVSLFLYSVPAFWLGIMALFALANYVPMGGMLTPGMHYANWFEGLLDLLHHLIVPMVVLTAVMLGQYVMLTRASLIDVLSEDYVITARAKGLNTREILRHHALPNAMLPLVTLTAINLSFIVGGAIQTETVFSWPGIGRLMYDSLMTRDYPILQGCFLILTIVALVANLLADITYFFLDPRVRIR
jgi:peptide/nickel transport system permease protein